MEGFAVRLIRPKLSRRELSGQVEFSIQEIVFGSFALCARFSPPIL